jgi:hypothetical protein
MWLGWGDKKYTRNFSEEILDKCPLRTPRRRMEDNIKNTCTSPYVFMTQCFVKHRDNFTFNLPRASIKLSLCDAPSRALLEAQPFHYATSSFGWSDDVTSISSVVAAVLAKGFRDFPRYFQNKFWHSVLRWSTTDFCFAPSSRGHHYSLILLVSAWIRIL